MKAVISFSGGNHRKVWFFQTLLFFWMCIAFAGCSFFKGPQSLGERAQEYWKYKVSGELEKAYLYETPAFREKVKLADYMSSDSKWLEARLGEVEVSGDRASVQVTVRFALMRPWFPSQGVEKTICDRWTLIDGVWYHQLGTAATENQ